MSHGSSNTVEPEPGKLSDPDRKLWLDYLSKLTDRRSQETKESGATTWVLFGVAVAIVYKAVPRIPDVLSIPGMARTISSTLLLEFNAAFSIAVVLASLASYVLGDIETRLLPKSTERLHKVAIVSVTGVEFLVGVLQLLASRWVTGAPWGKWALLVFGGFYLINSCAGVIRPIKTSRKAKSRGVPAPRFHVATLIRPIPTMYVHLLLGTVAFLGLWQYLKLLAQTSTGWLVPLGASTYALTFFSILAVLFARTLNSSSRYAYQSLERAILVENLTAAEIRSRFMEQILGAGVRDWLREIVDGLKRAEEGLEKTVDSIKERIPEIEGIDAKNVEERKRKVAELSSQLVAAIDKRKESIKQDQFRLAEYFSSGNTGADMDILRVVQADLNEWLNRVKVRAADSAAVLARIQALAPNSSTDPESRSSGPGSGESTVPRDVPKLQNEVN